MKLYQLVYIVGPLALGKDTYPYNTHMEVHSDKAKESKSAVKSYTVEQA